MRLTRRARRLFVGHRCLQRLSVVTSDLQAVDVLPSSGRELDGTARVLGYPAGTQGQFLDDYRRATRRARAVVERVFYE